MTYFATRVCSGFLCGLLCLIGTAQAQKAPSSEKSLDQAPKVPLAEKFSNKIEKVPPAENLFPKSTQGFISIANVEALIEHFNNTQLGRLTADPVMKPFTEDVKRQFESRWSNVHDRLGVTLDDLRDVPGGEVGIGLIEPAKKQSAIAISVDIAGHLDKAKEMLDKINKNLTAQGAERSELKSAYYPEPIVQFLLPLREEEREAEGTPLGAKTGPGPANPLFPTAEVPQTRFAFYFMSGNFLCTTDNLDVMHGILARMAGKGSAADSLADVPGFKMVSQRCASDAGEVVPQFRWFIHPYGYAAVARAATPPEQRRRGKTFVELMQNQGFDAIKGVGGYASFSDENFDLVHRTAVYAPEPYEKSMKMLKFLNGDDYTPQEWVPRDIATYSTFYFDILNAFDNFGPLFEELYGGGEPGYWIDTLESLRTDPHGPKIDLRKELVEHLDHRITIVTDYQMPITTSSERILIAIQVKEGTDERVALAIEKAMKGDPSAKPHKEDGLVIWEIVEPDESSAEVPQVEGIGDEPTMPKKKMINREERLFPHAAITVVNGQLYVASHLDFLQKILQPCESRKQLCNDADYHLVSDTIESMRPKEKCAHVFSRTDEEYHPTYELIRQNKLPESESMLNRILNQLFGEGKKGHPRQQKIDGSQLPEYDTVRRYLSPAGLQATAEKDGWFIKGFTVSQEPVIELKEEQKSAPNPEDEEKPKPETKEPLVDSDEGPSLKPSLEPMEVPKVDEKNMHNDEGDKR